jgi:hypothetical protein
MHSSAVSACFAAMLFQTLSLSGCDGDEPITVQECKERGGEPVGLVGSPITLGNRVGDLSADDDCPAGRGRIGTIRAADDPNGALCCLIPPSLENADCEALGGEIVLDPGDGSTYTEGCPDGRDLLGWLNECDTPGLCGEGGICCGGQEERKNKARFARGGEYRRNTGEDGLVFDHVADRGPWQRRSSQLQRTGPRMP